MENLNPYAIVEIKTQGLFGYIDQTLQPTAQHQDKVSRLAILYGENGTGKTSLLRLAFHLLSPHVDRGHKSRLANTPFKLFQIKLRDGTIFKAERGSARNGNYIFSVTPPNKDPLTHEFKLERGEISVLPYRYARNLRKEITRCASTIIFLRDDRLLDIDPNIDQGSPWAELFVDLRTPSRTKIQHLEDDRIRFRDQPDQLAAALRFSIERLDRWFSIQYGQQTSTGMASSHAIYEQVIQRVASTRQPQAKALPLDNIIQALVQVSEESAVFEKYGLSSRMDVDSIVKTLSKARESQIELLEGLLMPYIDTVRARLSALYETYETIDTLVTYINSFLSPKYVTYRVDEGLRIFSVKAQRLNPTELSSGERHLLLILSAAVLARTSPTIFVIDEPEISLNTVWQRDLADALLAVSKNSISQFIMASHSISLITNIRDHVLRLKHG